MEELKFSIITPSFNQGDFIEETILSVLNQKHQNIEYFIFDGGSTDQTRDVIKKYEKQISFWSSEKDKGQSHAINKGLQKATGDVLIWINSDDVLTENALSSAAHYFLNYPKIDVVHGRTILFQNDKELLKGADQKKLPEHYLSGMAFPQPSAFIRRSALQKYPLLNESLHYGMDFDLFVCLFLNGEFMNVPDVFSKYRLHQSSKTVLSSENFAKDWQKVFCKMLQSIHAPKEFRDSLIELDMWSDSIEKYPVSKYIDEQFLNKAFLYFLEFQIHFYYHDLKLQPVKKIGKFIKHKFPDFYREANIGRIYNVSRVPFARYLIPLLRQTTF